MNYDRGVIGAILLASATAVTLGKQVRSAIQSATKIATQLLTGSQGKLRRIAAAPSARSIKEGEWRLAAAINGVTVRITIPLL